MFGDLDTLEKQLAGVALQDFFEDDSVTDLLFLGHSEFYLDRLGRLEKRESPFSERQSFLSFLERIIVPTGRRQDARYPFLDGSLADGSRFHLVFPPVSPQGPLLSIRKLRRSRRLTLSDFAEDPAFDLESIAAVKKLPTALSRRENILISGGTGVGKTTFMGLLMDSQPTEIRWVVMEECQEVVTRAPHAIRLQGRSPSAEGIGEITLRMLVKNALRMRPDRMVLGECRGAEAFDLLQALMSGHGGSMGTIHASSALGALQRLEALAGLAGSQLSAETLRAWIAQSVRWVAHLTAGPRGRKLAEVLRIEGLELGKYRVFPEYKADKS